MPIITTEICTTKGQKYFDGKKAIALVKLINIDQQIIEQGETVTIKRRSSNSKICLDIESTEGVVIRNVWCENLSMSTYKKGTEIICENATNHKITFYVDTKGNIRSCSDLSYVGGKISLKTIKVGEPCKLIKNQQHKHSFIPFTVTSIKLSEYAID